MVSVSQLPQKAWEQLLELWEDCPAQFEMLAEHLSRGKRPPWGSLTIFLQKGEITQIDKKETLKQGPSTG